MYAAIRIRGEPDTRKNARETLERLGLTAQNHVALLPEDDNYRGMLTAAKDYITFGQVDASFAAELLEEHGETRHGSLADSLDELGYESVEELVQALDDGAVTLSDLKQGGFRNVVRLTPPSKGYNDTRRHYSQGGSLGDRGDAIQDLLARMK
ncbi:MAG: 50S ribosomal protein L30 [Candidatus Nanohaloarchaea archaeon]|nr:50S ribosomal protein L30 [Candidatus Nanohaloarchaea archaeon]